MKISVIIPAFNAENYIEECIQSVIENKQDNLEVIIINDGSIDRTAEIISSFKENFIKVIHTENQGQSAARNIGISISTGDYIIFLDSDDKLHKNALLRLTEEIITQKADVIFFESQVFFDDDLLSGKFNPNYDRNPTLENKKFSGVDFFKHSIQINNYIVSPCLFIASKEAISGTTFKEGIIHEDNLFTTSILLGKNISVMCIKEKLHLRRVRHGSVMTQLKNQKHLDGYHACINELISNPPLNSTLALEEYNTFLCHMADCLKHTALEIINQYKYEIEQMQRDHKTELHQARVDISVIKRSSSWRITAPLRKMKDLITR